MRVKTWNELFKWMQTISFILAILNLFKERLLWVIYLLISILVIEFVFKQKPKFDNKETLDRLNKLIDEQKETLEKFRKANEIE